ncbi:uncharacterized protein [Fopius arisanus]|uniref:Peptidase A2 domain-containing protein n=1 Tax=Fopius arisanus TaxID=64838 RepID=A0A9R1TRC5_9HYME|nr:PREDICTED: uncharacterized protein LOC105272908 [Fopius arisanus]
MRLCFTCFGTHSVAKCKCTKSCFRCPQPRHTLLQLDHKERVDTSTQQTTLQRHSQRGRNQVRVFDLIHDYHSSLRTLIPHVPSSGHNKSTSIIINEKSTPRETTQPINVRENDQSDESTDNRLVLLATAQARAVSNSGYHTIARILIDQGSKLTFISESLDRQLQVQRRHSIELIGIGGKHACKTRGIVTITLQSTKAPFHRVKINVHVLQKLTTRLPTFSCSSASIGSLQQLQLAGENYSTPGPINIIIGADNYGKIIGYEVKKSNDEQLVGQLTTFGWIIFGPLCNIDCSRKVSLSAARGSSNEQLTQLLQKFWVQEELPTAKDATNELPPEERECEEHFRRTH